MPEAASSLLFPRLAGRRRAARYLLLAEPFGADEAEAIGLVSHRVAAGGLDAKLDEIVAALLAKPAEALRLTQKLLRTAHAGRNSGANEAGEHDVRRAARFSRSQGRDRRLLREEGMRSPLK